MKKVITLSFLLGFFVILSYAQELADKDFYLADSLVLEDFSEYDRELVDSVLEEYHRHEDDTLKLADLSNLIQLCYRLNVVKIYNPILKEEVERAIASTTDKLLINKYKLYLGHYYMIGGYVNSMEGDNIGYATYLDSSEVVFREINDSVSLGIVYIFRASLFDEIGKYSEAIDNCNQGLSILEDLEDLSGQKQAHYILGGIRHAIEDNANAIVSYNRSFEIAKEQGDDRFMALNLLPMSQIYVKDNKIDSAKLFVFKAIEYSSNIDDLSEVGQGKYILAEIAILNDSIEKAMQLYKENIATYRNLNDMAGLSLNLKSLAELQYEAKNYTPALQNGLEAYQLSSQADNTMLLDVSTALLANIYEALADDKSAMFYLKENKEIKAKLFDTQNKNASVNQEYEYQYEKQKEIDDLKHKQEIALEEEKNQKQKMALYGTGAGLFIFALLLAFIFNRMQVIRVQKAKLDDAYFKLEESKKNELAVSNLKALQSQMNPHFIFNALNSVQDLVLLKDIRSSNKFLGKFSDLIRKILLSSKEQFISLEEEIEILGLYLDLEKLRFGEEFNIDFSCEVSQDKQEEIQLPAMFIQPYIENAIKHGLFSKKGEKQLEVAFSLLNDNTLECIVQDNGIGQKQAAIMKEQRLHLHTGFSTEAINERIRLLNQTLDKKIDLQIIDLEENGKALGTKIILQFPI